MGNGIMFDRKEVWIIAFTFLGIGIAVVLGLLVILFSDAATVKTQVINPKPGIECVVASTTDSIAVDCWEISD